MQENLRDDRDDQGLITSIQSTRPASRRSGSGLTQFHYPIPSLRDVIFRTCVQSTAFAKLVCEPHPHLRSLSRPATFGLAWRQSSCFPFGKSPIQSSPCGKSRTKFPPIGERCNRGEAVLDSFRIPCAHALRCGPFARTVDQFRFFRPSNMALRVLRRFNHARDDLSSTTWSDTLGVSHRPDGAMNRR